MNLRRIFPGTPVQSRWADGLPIRSELFGVERLEEQARSLAAAQPVAAKNARGAGLSERSPTTPPSC